MRALGTCAPSTLSTAWHAVPGTRTRRGVFSSLVASWSTTAAEWTTAGTFLSALRLNTSSIFSLSHSLTCRSGVCTLPTRHCLLLTSTSVSAHSVDSHSLPVTAVQQQSVRQWSRSQSANWWLIFIRIDLTHKHTNTHQNTDRHWRFNLRQPFCFLSFFLHRQWQLTTSAPVHSTATVSAPFSVSEQWSSSVCLQRVCPLETVCRHRMAVC